MKNLSKLILCFTLGFMMTIDVSAQWTNVASPKLTSGNAEIEKLAPWLMFDLQGDDNISGGLLWRNDNVTVGYSSFLPSEKRLQFQGTFAQDGTTNAFSIDLDKPTVSATSNGYVCIGSEEGQRLAIDYNVIQAKTGTSSFNNLYLNYHGGDIRLANNLLNVDRSTLRVGIGTTAPAVKLEVQFTGTDGIHIDGDDTGDARLSIENGGGSHYIFDDDSDAHSLDIESANDLNFNTNGPNERMSIDANGLVDIHKSSEALRLSGTNSYLSFYNLSTSGSPTISSYLQGTTTDLNLINLTAGDLVLRTTGDDVIVHCQDEFRIKTGNAENMIVDALGNVGIGTSTPKTKLHIQNGTGAYSGAPIFANAVIEGSGNNYLNLNGGAGFYSGLTFSGAAHGLQAGMFFLDGPDYLMFRTGAIDGRMVIAENGNVGIGTYTPTKTLEVIGQMKLTNTLTANTDKQSLMLMGHYSGGTTDFGYFKAQSSSTQNSVNFGGGAGANYAATSLSFFTANNTTTLNGDVRLRFRFDGRSIFQTGSSTGSTYPTDHNVWGTAGKPGGGNWSGISDRRLKKGVRAYTDGLDEIMRIEPVFYSYDENEVGGTHGSEFVGIIAQDMQKIAPYTVSEVEWANEEHRSPYKTVLTYDGTAIPYMLINAVKAQQEEIQGQQEQIQTQANIIVEKDAQIQANVESIKSLEDKVNKLFALLDKAVDNSTTVKIKVNQVEAQIDITKDVAQLEQNIPNPFNENTVINYFIPSGTKTAAMNILDANGRLIKSIKLNETGKGQLNLKANNLPSGTFIYQLIADNVKIDSKQMISIK